MEMQKPNVVNIILKAEEESERTHAIWLENLQWSSSDKDCGICKKKK